MHNNQALSVIGSMCAVGVSKRVSERGEEGEKESQGYLWRGVLGYMSFVLLLSSCLHCPDSK